MSRFFPCVFPLACTFLLLTVWPTLASAQRVIQVANVSSETTQTQHPIDPALEIARASLLHTQEQIQDYTALFVKRCRVDGVLPPLSYAKVKVRNRKVQNGVVTTPMGVYLDFLKPDAVKGREVIWMEGANDGDMVVHQGGLARFVTVNIAPNGYLAMRGQRYPITEIGIENLLKKIIEAGQRDRKYGECEMKVFNDAKVGKMACTMIEVTHPVRRDHFDFHRARIYFSDSLKVPVRYKSWSWPESPEQEPPLQEEYNYLRVQLNVGLTDQDFNSENPKYRYH